MNCVPRPVVFHGPEVRFDWAWPFGPMIGLAGFVVWVWALVEVLTKETDENNQRLIWGLVVGFTYFIGALIYLIVRRPERLRTLGR